MKSMSRTPRMVGLREANQKFSSLIKSVRSGKEVILTDRGNPVVRISPVRPEQSAQHEDTEQEAIKRMVESGFLIPARKKGPMPPYKGHRLRGKSIVDTLREMRDED